MQREAKPQGYGSYEQAAAGRCPRLLGDAVDPESCSSLDGIVVRHLLSAQGCVECRAKGAGLGFGREVCGSGLDSHVKGVAFLATFPALATGLVVVF